MEAAIRAAERGVGSVEPNPPVGAVVVRGGRAVAAGHHSRYGGPHAEIVALGRAGTLARGATLYVTLEPCSSVGKTPPCVDSIAASGVRRVVVGAVDPDPRHRGRGIERLRALGLKVPLHRSPISRECARLLERFSMDLASPFPLVEAKWAMTVDGRAGLGPDEVRARGSAVLSGARAYAAARLLRAESDAVLVGGGTVESDDPETAVPVPPGRRPPWRVVVDGRLRFPLESSRIVRSASPSRAVAVVTTAAAPAARVRALEAAGARVVMVPSRGGAGRVDLRAAFRALKRLGLKKLFVEGGPRLVAAALATGLVERITVAVAPRLLGGAGRPAAVRAAGSAAADAMRKLRFRVARSARIGDDLLVRCVSTRPRRMGASK